MKFFEIIIIGGSFAGLSAAMSLGRALRNVLIIDSGKPCNYQSNNAHNLITQDGDSPEKILQKAKNKIFQYPEISFVNDFVTNAKKDNKGFSVTTQSGLKYSSKKLIIATGVKDILPDIYGFKECWGISILHCPYCHGYEFKMQPTAIYGDSKYVFNMARTLSKWTDQLQIIISGENLLNNIQLDELKKRNVLIHPHQLLNITHREGIIQRLELSNGESISVKALYSKPKIQQQHNFDEQLGYELTDKGLINVDILQKTTQTGIYACGDNSTHGRSIAMAISTGSLAGIMCNKELILDDTLNLNNQ
jgi:thioredoxin reductase